MTASQINRHPLDIGPLYVKVKRHLLDRILTRQLNVGEKVESENDLVRAFGISRMTANRALKELTEEGYLVRVAGVGTFVADFTAKSPLLEVRNIADEVRARGHAYSCKIIFNRQEPAPADIAARLGLGLGAAVHHTLIVHRERDVPIQLEERYVDLQVVPAYGEQDFSRTTPGEYLLRTVPLGEAEHTVKAVMPDAVVRELLCMDTNEPCLVVERQTWSDGKAVTHVVLYHPASRFELSGRFRP